MLKELLSSFPTPSEKRIALHVTPAAERSLRNGHPWLFNEAIRRQSHDGKPGDLAVVFNQKRRFLAVGLYDPDSPIRVRVLQHKDPIHINQEWFRRKIIRAQEIRSRLPEYTNGYRMFHGENDGFPGLVLDIYADTGVLKIYTAAWIPFLRDLLPLFINLSPKRIILRLSREVSRRPEHLYGLEDSMILWGASLNGPVLFQENGLSFEADPIRGQKTGFFLDQRDNRARVESLAEGNSVLNLFAYTGSFSIYAARGGAKSITSVDISRPALEAAERNFSHNKDHPSIAAADHQIIVGDVFDVLTQFKENHQHFDMVIIDPPSFAKRKTEVKKALFQYRRLTRLGLSVLNPGGILVQSSCSSRITPEDFFSVIQQEAQLAGNHLKEIERTGHALDHPIKFPEGEYLKCLFSRTSAR
ncbi:MAG: class I SAM-dependent methyltransferase [Anaerolineales bacterium]|nr:class I SAM-dependent methyltransferase [Chloroflexota bacterium]MBL6982903.1 class I SAM-dependent methyltransferase [Anaerolineales bacterium]